MGNLENAIAQCKGVEAQGENGKVFDMGRENARLLAEFNNAVNANDKGSGITGYLKGFTGKIDGSGVKNALAADVSARMQNVEKQGLFDACSDVGNKIRSGISASRNPDAAKMFISSVARQNPAEIAGTKRGAETAVAQADHFQDGINALRPGARAAALKKAMGE